jgi:hypothetical protein
MMKINNINTSKKNRSKNLDSATCQILIDGWKLITLMWRYGCIVVVDLHNAKCVVLTKLQLNYNELHCIYDALQLFQLM